MISAALSGFEWRLLGVLVASIAIVALFANR